MSADDLVAVIGAGPAGSSAAGAAAASGAEVVLIDRKTEIGCPVQCGGFLPEALEIQRMLPDARLSESISQPPERCIIHRTGLQRIYSPSGSFRQFQVAGRVIDRRAYDRHLAACAARAGARLLSATRARLKDGALLLKGRGSGTLWPRLIIGADGPHSMLSRAMGNPVQELGLCMEYEMANVAIDPDAVEMYFSAGHAPGGYAWIIPLGQDTANVGIGVRASYLSGEGLPGLLERFIKEHHVASQKLAGGQVLAVMRGTVPAGGSVRTIASGNMILAGDAAGHVMASSGGGIPLAVIAGRIAGELAGEVAGPGRVGDIAGAIASYPSRIEREMGGPLRRSVQLRRMVDIAMKSDRLMNSLFAALSPTAMKSVMRAQIPEIFRTMKF